MNITDQAQQMSQGTAAKILIATGGGGSFIQAITEWSNVFVALGNAALVAAGLYLAYHKIKEIRK